MQCISLFKGEKHQACFFTICDQQNNHKVSLKFIVLYLVNFQLSRDKFLFVSSNHGISPLRQLLLTLRFYALGSMLLSVADFVGVPHCIRCQLYHSTIVQQNICVHTLFRHNFFVFLVYLMVRILEYNFLVRIVSYCFFR